MTVGAAESLQPATTERVVQERYFTAASSGRVLGRQPNGANSALLDTLPISGVRSMSVDFFPGRLAAVVLCGGGIAASRDGGYSWRAVEHFLSRWGCRLSGVAFSNIQPDLPAALREAVVRARELGFATALHTQSDSPAILKSLLPLLDWVSLEIAAAGPGESPHLRANVHHLLESKTDFECKVISAGTEIVPDKVRADAQCLARHGVRNIALHLAHPELLTREAPGLFEEMSKLFNRFAVRPLH